MNTSTQPKRQAAARAAAAATRLPPPRSAGKPLVITRADLARFVGAAILLGATLGMVIDSMVPRLDLPTPQVGRR